MKPHLFFLALLLLPLIMCAQMVHSGDRTFHSVYDLQLQCPRQVTWTIHAADIDPETKRLSWSFANDIPHPLALARHSDFNKTGFERGHMCPAQDRSRSAADMRSTFVLSNVAPQVPSVNKGGWKQTENLCRAYATIYDSVSCIVCPVFLDRDTLYISKHHLAVPHAFFKAVWRTDNDSVLNAWLIFNK